jgi:hypothetical protein
MMQRARLVRTSVALLAIGIGAGCSGAALVRPPTLAVEKPRSASLEEVRSAYDAYCRAIETVSASGDLDVSDLRTGKTQKLGVRLLAARGGRLYLKGSVAIVTAVEVSSDGERFWFMVPSRKTVWTGDAQASPASERAEAPYYALRPGDIASALLPAPLDPGPDEALAFEADRGGFTISVVPSAGGSVRRRVRLERASLLPRRLQSFDAAGELVSDVALGRHRDGVALELVLERPVEGYRASFSLDRSQRNAPAPERAFNGRTPDGYKVVEVQ